MIVFGKKCPACGGKHLTAISLVSRIISLQVYQTFTCEDCRQRLVFLFPFSISMDHRLHVRKKLPPHFLIHISGCISQYARIKNISEGGICFSHSVAPFASRFLMLDLYDCNSGASLEQLSVEIVATSEQLIDAHGTTTTMLNNCARFVNLNQAQKKILSACIAQYGTF